MSRKIFIYFVATGLALTAVSPTLAQTVSQPTSQPVTLQALVDRAASETLAKFSDKKLQQNDLAITLIDLRNPTRPVTASFRGNERIYPASVVKLFYLVAAHRWLEDKKIEDTARTSPRDQRHGRRFL